jgi:hypothetical protein
MFTFRCVGICQFLIVICLASATFCQVLHPINGQEIPLDDFPILVPGYRIELSAFNSQEKADCLKRQLQSKLSTKVHLRQEGESWQVRVGDFSDSVSATEYLHSRAFKHWSKRAAVVADYLPVPSDSLPPQPKVSGYRLQVYALADQRQAMKSGRNLTCLFPQIRVHVIYSDSLYKIQLGDFTDSAEVAEWKEKVTGVADMKPIIVQTQIYNLPAPDPSMSAPRDIFRYDD